MPAWMAKQQQQQLPPYGPSGGDGSVAGASSIGSTAASSTHGRSSSEYPSTAPATGSASATSEMRTSSSPAITTALPPSGSVALSRILLLRNMVGSFEEVDDDLEEDIKSKCSEYGQVHNVIIYQTRAKSVSAYVEFADLLGAQRAQQHLHGRYFAGRDIAATFFDLEKYNRLEFD
jgi:RNA-binding protein 39